MGDQELEHEPIPDYGEHFTLEDFKDIVKSGAIVDSDGCGSIATKDKMYDIAAIPSDIASVPNWVTHIVWFNK